MSPSYLSLLLVLISYSFVGWITLGDMVPLYILPLVFGVLFTIARPSFYTIHRTTMPFVAFLTLFIAWQIFIFSLVSTVDNLRALAALLNWCASGALFYFAYHTAHQYSASLVLPKVYAGVHTAGLVLALLQVALGIGYFAPSLYPGGAAGFEGMSFLFGKNYLPLLAFGLAGISLFKSPASTLLSREATYWFLFVGVCGVVLSESRSTQFGALIGFLLILPRIPFRFAAIGSATTVMAATYLLATSTKWDGILPEDYESLEEMNVTDLSIKIRLYLWVAAWDMIKDNPLLGVGGGNFRFHVADYGDGGGHIARVASGLDPHNVFIGLLAESGVVGIVAFVAMLAYTMWLARRLYKEPAVDALQRYVALATYLYLVMFIVDMNFHNYFNDNNLWLFLGFFYAVVRMRHGYVQLR